MRSSIEFSFCAFTSVTFSYVTFAVVLEGRDPARSDITRAAQATTFPTVPAFSAPSFTYGAFSEIYPSGYTLPTAPFITATASSFTISKPSGPHELSPSEIAEDAYLGAMCAPQPTSSQGLSAGDQNFPCNRVTNSSVTCIYNATLQDFDDQAEGGQQLRAVSAQAQKDCLCPGGKGERIWENIEGCDECIRLHGGTPLNASRQDGVNAFIPTAYIKDLSSAYCAQKTASNGWDEFYADFSRTHPLSFGTETGGSDLLESKTAVSNYFTETSGRTPAITTGSQNIHTGNTSQTSVSTKPSSTSDSPASGTATAAASSTGGATALGTSAFLGVGLLGIAWFL